MKWTQAQYLLNRTIGLKFESTRKFALAPKDLEAAEVLRNTPTRFAGREEDDETNAASAQGEPVVSSQGQEADQVASDVWLTSVLRVEQLSEGNEY